MRHDGPGFDLPGDWRTRLVEVVRGAEELGEPLDEHVQFVIDAMASIASSLGLAADQVSSTN